MHYAYQEIYEDSTVFSLMLECWRCIGAGLRPCGYGLALAVFRPGWRRYPGNCRIAMACFQRAVGRGKGEKTVHITLFPVIIEPIAKVLLRHSGENRKKVGIIAFLNGEFHGNHEPGTSINV